MSYPEEAMCGVVGVLSRDGPPDPSRVARMARTLAHRGPDGEGLLAADVTAFGHRRLSVIDLSESAAQPMTNEDGTLWLSFNGEIYNFRELRSRLLPRHRFRSRSDSEVILHLYEERGDDLISELDGMFAFALWDARERRLLLARDRAGKKPLYYHDGPRLFAFASEIKALLAHGVVPREINRAAIPLYLVYGYVPTPDTLYRDIHSLPPGHVLVATENHVDGPRCYWAPRFRNGGMENAAAARERLRELLRQATRRRLVSDVPLGAFLSGGLDSSSVVAFMADEASGRVRTFSIGFAGGVGYDERSYARLVAERFGTDHTEFVVEPRALDLIDRLVWHHDGPFGDSSAIPTYLLAELTRAQVTVALNGDGGDEVFAGYLRFYGGIVSERMPTGVSSALSSTLRHLPEPRDRKHPLRIAKRFAEALRLPLVERYLRWNAFFPSDLDNLLAPELYADIEHDRLLESFRDGLEGQGSTLSRLLQLNFKTYLLDDLLVKMDRMSMAHGLETRSPFLDTRIVEFGASLPDRLRMRWGRGKVLLREAMRGILPDAILKRGKMGFGAPLGTWFRSDLSAFIHERLLEPTSPIYRYVRCKSIESLVKAHMEATVDMSPQIWALLTLESWLRQERNALPGG